MNRRSPMRTYWPWLLACALMGVTILFAPDRSQVSDPLLSADFTLEPGEKVTSAKSFASLLANQDDEPLYKSEQYREQTANSAYEIHLDYDPKTWAFMLVPDNRYYYRDHSVDAVVRFGDRSPQPAVTRVRGRGSLKMENKPSFKIVLTRGESFARDISLRDIYLMNMRYDSAEYLMAWTYQLLEELDLFHLHNQYVRVTVNGAPLGMYLLVEPPEEGIIRNFPDTVAIYRRRDDPGLYTLEWGDSVPNADQSVSGLIELNRQEKIPNPIEAFERVINLDQYLRWLAINSILRNQDHLDEIFLYERRTGRNQVEPLQLMAWDYDDIATAGEKGNEINDPHFWSSLSETDAVIFRHPELFDRYKEILREMLLEVPVGRIESLMTEAHRRRQSLDDGRPPEVQAAFRAEAEKTFQEHLRLLKERHAQLRALLGVSP